MRYLALDERIADTLKHELLNAAPLESGAFCLLRSVTIGRVERLILGPPVETLEPWVEQDELRLTPSGRAISQAVSAATSARAGLAFVHSHPQSVRRPQLSGIDRETSLRLGAAFHELLDGPFVSLVVSPAGFGGAYVGNAGLEAIERMSIVGRRVEPQDAPTTRPDPSLDDRQVRALGAEVQRRLRGLRVAVIGAGGLGSPVAETLVRMGAGRVVLVDFDELDTPSNARRVFGVGLDEVETEPPLAKAEAVASGLSRLRLGGKVDAVVGDVREPSVKEVLLEADVVINGTDSHSSRAALTELAIKAALPVIDLGVRVGARRDGGLDSLAFERRVLIPAGPCLWCWDRLSAEQVRAELLPDDERESLEAEGYVTGNGAAPTPSVAALTVAAAGAATSGLLGMLSGAFDVAPLAVSVDALGLAAHPLPRQEPDPECICSTWRTSLPGV